MGHKAVWLLLFSKGLSVCNALMWSLGAPNDSPLFFQQDSKYTVAIVTQAPKPYTIYLQGIVGFDSWFAFGSYFIPLQAQGSTYVYSVYLGLKLRQLGLRKYDSSKSTIICAERKIDTAQ